MAKAKSYSGKRPSSMSISLQAMALCGILSLFLFSYLPMFGITIAFQDYTLSSGFFSSPFVGLKHFYEFLHDPTFYMAAKNTLILSLLKLAVCFPIPIFLALVLNELPFPRFKGAVQTISYFPHFIAYVVVAGLWLNLLDARGLVNNALTGLGLARGPTEFWTETAWYWPLVIIIELWKESGWGSLIYVAAISGINAELYEAARIDGAGKIKQIIHITLPCISGTIIVMLILATGGILRGNLDQSVLFGNTFNKSASYIIEKYVLDMGFGTMRYSFASAVSLLQGVLSLFLVIGTNWLSRKITGKGIM